MTDTATSTINAPDHAQIDAVIGINQGYVTYNKAMSIYQEQVHTKEIDPVAAADLLATLPTDTIPNPALLPQGSRMPYVVNPHFVGQEHNMITLAAAFKHANATVKIAAATGIGGIGKTQLASEFVHRYGQFFAGGVYWLSFADPTRIPAEIASCAPPQVAATLDLPQQVAFVQQEWQSPIPRLLVFDNCENEALLHQWRPTTGGCRILVTSRLAHWEDINVHKHPLDALAREQSIALLCQFRPDLPADDADLDALAAELGDLPMALHLAGSYLKKYTNRVVTPATLLAQFQQPDLLNHRALQGKHTKQSYTNHDLNIGRSFALSYGQLHADDEIDALAIQLLARMAYFAPGEPVPADLLLETLEEHQADAQLDMEDALVRLKSLGLLEAEADDALRLHRLLAMFVQQMATDDTAQAAVEQIMLKTANRLNNAGDPRPLLALQSHLRHITDVALTREDEMAARLSNMLGYYLKIVGNYAAARPYFERALEINEMVMGATHFATATSLNNMGALLQDIGKLEAARPYFERALDIRKAVLGVTHPLTATSLNNMGLLLRVMGELNNARPYFERALEVNEAVLGASHPYTAQSLNNMGMLLQDIGELDNAQLYFERALAIFEAVLGAQHPDTANSLNNLGGLLYAMDEYEAARPYYERALAVREAVLGAQHPDTASSLNTMGELLQSMGEYEAARPYIERALAIHEQVLGATHPTTAMSFNTMGELLQNMGEYEAARPYIERALAIHEQVLGATHPFTAQSLNNLGTLLQNMGEYEAARPYFQRALDIRKAVLGATHALTTQSLNNLGISMFALAAKQAWQEWEQEIRSHLVFHGEVIPKNLERIPAQYRAQALQRYVETYQSTQALQDYTGYTLCLLNDTLVQRWNKAWRDSENSIGSMSGVAKSGRKAIDELSAVLSEVVGFNIKQSRDYQGMCAYRVEAPALRLKLPASFPLVFVADPDPGNQTLKTLVDAIDILKEPGYFVLVVCLGLRQHSGEIVKKLRHVIDASPHVQDFIVLSQDDVLNILIARNPTHQLAQYIVGQVDLSVVSPFVTSGPVPETMFFGREAEIRLLVEHANKADFAVVGNRKIGKTSLLQRTHHRMEANGHVHPVSINCQTIRHATDFFLVFQKTMNHTSTITTPEDFAAIVREHIHSTGKPLVLLMDEVDRLLATDYEQGESLAAIWRALAQDGICHFIFCGSTRLIRQLDNPHTVFFNFPQAQPLGYLSPDTARMVLTQPLQTLGVELEDKQRIVDEVITLTAGHPNLVQYVGRELVHAANLRRERLIRMADMETVKHSNAFTEFYLATIWGEAGPLEKLITLVAPHDSFCVGDIEATLASYEISVAAQKLDSALKMLCTYAILEKREKTYTFIPGSFLAILHRTQEVERLIAIEKEQMMERNA